MLTAATAGAVSMLAWTLLGAAVSFGVSLFFEDRSKKYSESQMNRSEKMTAEYYEKSKQESLAAWEEQKKYNEEQSQAQFEASLSMQRTEAKLQRERAVGTHYSMRGTNKQQNK